MAWGGVVVGGCLKHLASSTHRTVEGVESGGSGRGQVEPWLGSELGPSKAWLAVRWGADAEGRKEGSLKWG